MKLSELQSYVIANAGEYLTPESTAKDIYEYLREDEYVETLKVGSRRWWKDVIRIVKVGDKFIGFADAETTGDNSPSDVGYEPEFDIQEYKPKEKTITTYEVYSA